MFENYLKNNNYSTFTIRNYLYSINKFKKFLQKEGLRTDNISIINMSKGIIYNYIASMNENSYNTKIFNLKALKCYYKYLQNELEIEDIKLFDKAIKIPYILNTEEIKKCLNYYSDTQKNLIIHLLYFNGIRLGELLSIKKSNIKNNQILIKGKTGERIIYLYGKTLKLLNKYIKDKDNYIFDMNRRTVQYIITNMFKNLNIKGSVHTLRHTSATHLYQRTNNLLLIKEFLGHKSIVSTQIYTKIDNKNIKDAVEKNPLSEFIL